MKKVALLAVAALALAGAGVATAAAVTSRSSSGTVTLHKTKLGKVLATSSGRTLYLFMKDKNGKSACYGQCASNWPPLMKKGTLRAGTGVKAKLLGTTTRKNGKRQVTYNHHPLYLYAGDAAAGKVSGQGLNFFGGKWWVLSAAGTAIKAAPAGGGTTTTYTVPTYP